MPEQLRPERRNVPFAHIPFEWTFDDWYDLIDPTVLTEGNKIYDADRAEGGTVDGISPEFVTIHWMPTDHAPYKRTIRIAVFMEHRIYWVDPALQGE